MDEEDYDFMYEDEETSEPDVDLENQYYNSKGAACLFLATALKENSPKEAIAGFQMLTEMEQQKSEWGFRAIKQIVKLNFLLKNYTQCASDFKKMLEYVSSNAVTKNMSEKSISNLLEHLSSSTNYKMLEEIYNETLDCLRESKNDRLWFKTQLSLGKLYYRAEDYQKLKRVLSVLESSMEQKEKTNSDDVKKGTHLLEVYALQIQMYTAIKNNKKLEEYYIKSLAIKSAIPHPKIMGLIRECGGKMYMRKENWEKAQTDFFEAFKNFDEAGSASRIQCLKYLVLANMLSNSTINPFDSQETKPYMNDPEILVMKELVSAYQNNDISQFESIFNANRESIMSDVFLRDYIEELLFNIRTRLLLKILDNHDVLSFDFLAAQLNIPISDIETLLLRLIMDGSVKGKIDQVQQTLLLVRPNHRESFYLAVQRLALSAERLISNIAKQATQ